MTYIILTLWLNGQMSTIDVPPPYQCEVIAAALVTQGYVEAAACTRAKYEEENGE